MFFWRRVAPQIPEEGLQPTATPAYSRNFRELNRLVSEGKSFSGYERNPLFLNLRGKGFAEIGGLAGVDYDDDARAVAAVDWDRDGDLDLWLTNRTAPRIRFLRNNHPFPAASLAVRIIGNGTTTNRDAVGARLTWRQASGPPLAQIRTVRAGDGFLAQSSAWIHFGLGEGAGEGVLTVRWPGGETEAFPGLRPGMRCRIEQGRGRVEAWEPAVESGPVSGDGLAVEDPGAAGFWVANRVPFPELIYTAGDGTTRSTAALSGGPVLVNLWATWCAPCLRELAGFAGQADAIRARGASVLALHVDGLAADGGGESGIAPAAALAETGYDLAAGVVRLEDVAKIRVLIEFLSARRGPLSIPSSFLIDREGNVAAVYLEALTENRLTEDLALLEAPASRQLERLSPRPGRWLADPRRADPSVRLADYAALFGSNGFPEEAQRLMEKMPDNGRDWTATEYYNRAKAAAAQGQRETAEEYYRAAIDRNPRFGQAFTGLGAVLLMERRVDEAQALFEKALEIDPDHATALVNLAVIDQSRGDNASALDRLERVVAKNPDYAEARLNLGSLLASMERYPEAIGHLSKAVERLPQSAPARLSLAAVHLQTQQWDEAEAQYRQAQQLSPRTAHIPYALGVVLARKGLHAEAAACCREAIALGGGDARTYTQFGLSLLALGEEGEAAKALQTALRLDPGHEEAKRAMESLSTD